MHKSETIFIPPHLKGGYIGISVWSGGRVVGRSGGRAVGCQSCVANFPQFLTNSHEIWQRCLPWSVDVQDTFFDSDRKSVQQLWQKWGENLASRYFLSWILMKFGTYVVTFFDSVAILWQK